MPQGISADLIATKYGFSRDDVDAYAVESQQRAAQAWDEGRFKNSVIAGEGRQRPHHPGQGRAHAADARPCSRSPQLQPSFVQMGEMARLRRGRGAALSRGRGRQPRAPRRQLVRHRRRRRRGADRQQGRRHARPGSKPRARIRAFANIGSEPAIMLTGPVDGDREGAREAPSMKLKDIDLFELNEAFASVVLRYMQAFNIDHDKINVNGGAIAMGHPLGATGAMILGTVLDELERRNLADRAGDACASASAWAPRPSSSGCTDAEDRHRQASQIDTLDRLSARRSTRRSRAARASGSAAPPAFDQFGVNICTLKPGAASSQRHWHEKEDEFVYVLEGEVVLCEDDGETVLKPGDAAALEGRRCRTAIAWSTARVAMPSFIEDRHARGASAPTIPTSTWHGRRAATKGARYTKKNGEPY